MKKITNLMLFELSYTYIQELDLKLITKPLKSTKSLILFSIKSINCFNRNTAEHITSIVAENIAIKHLEISNGNMKQNMMIKIAESIKAL